MAIDSITTASAKLQLGIRSDETEHDARVAELIAAAEMWAVQYCNLETLDDFDAENSPPTTMPADVKQALRLHVQAHFDTEPGQMALLLRTAEDLLWPHRTGLGV